MNNATYLEDVENGSMQKQDDDQNIGHKQSGFQSLLLCLTVLPAKFRLLYALPKHPSGH